MFPSGCLRAWPAGAGVRQRHYRTRRAQSLTSTKDDHMDLWVPRSVSGWLMPELHHLPWGLGTHWPHSGIGSIARAEAGTQAAV